MIKDNAEKELLCSHGYSQQGNRVMLEVIINIITIIIEYRVTVKPISKED